MGKRKRNKNNKVASLEGTDDSFRQVRFQLEENAGEIFSEFLDQEFPGHILDEKEQAERPVNTGKKRQTRKPEPEIDLHGLHLDEAIYRVTAFLRDQQVAWKGKLPCITCKVITGRGLHSRHGTSILAGEVYEHVKRTFKKSLIRIDPPPLDSTINGIPLRGSFCLTLKTSPG